MPGQPVRFLISASMAPYGPLHHRDHLGLLLRTLGRGPGSGFDGLLGLVRFAAFAFFAGLGRFAHLFGLVSGSGWPAEAEVLSSEVVTFDMKFSFATKRFEQSRPA